MSRRTTVLTRPSPLILPPSVTAAAVADIDIEEFLPPPEFFALDDQLIDILRGAGSADELWPAPTLPPAEFFEPIPNLTPGQKCHVTASSEVFGYFFEWGQCVIGSPVSNTPGRQCFQPIPSPTGYERFHQGTTVTAAGGLATGMIGADGHAPPHLNVVQSMAHYQNPLAGKMEGRIYENEVGGYFHGVLTPQATVGDVKMILASALSGDWRWITNMRLPDGSYADGWDCLGPCLVMRPGLPLARETRPSMPVLASAQVDAGRAITIPTTGEPSMPGTTNPAATCPSVQAAGLSSEARREALQQAVRLHQNLRDDEYVWVADYDDTHVYYEIAETGMVALAYTETEGSIAVTGEPAAAQRTFQIVPGGEPAPTQPAVAPLTEAVTAAGDGTDGGAGSLPGPDDTTDTDDAAGVAELNARMDALEEIVAGLQDAADQVDELSNPDA